jgi:DNA-binding CsgD family transcriptional regulator
MLKAGKGKTKLELKPYFIGFGLYCTSVFLLISRNSFLANSADNVAPVLLGTGCVFAAITLIVIDLRLKTARPLVSYLTAFWILASLLAFICAVTARFSSEGSFALDCIVASISGAAVAVGAALWIVAFRRLTLRNAFLNTALAIFVHALVYGLTMSTVADYGLIVAVSCNLCSAFSCTMLLRVPPDESVRSDEKRSLSLGDMLRRLLSSVPVIGLAVSYLTLGAGRFDSGFDFEVIVFSILAAGLIIIIFVMTPYSRSQERGIVYTAFRIALPAVISVALLIRMIPSVLMVDTVFIYYMNFLFQLLLPMAFIFTANLIRANDKYAFVLCGAVSLVLSLSFLLGYTVRTIDELLFIGFMGAATAFFLLYSFIYLCRSVLLFFKGPDSEAEINVSESFIDSACRRIASQHGLSPRESEVLVELAYGHASSYIAKVLFISNNTARTHMKNIYRKLSINSREELLEMVRKPT